MRHTAWDSLMETLNPFIIFLSAATVLAICGLGFYCHGSEYIAFQHSAAADSISFKLTKQRATMSNVRHAVRRRVVLMNGTICNDLVEMVTLSFFGAQPKFKRGYSVAEVR